MGSPKISNAPKSAEDTILHQVNSTVACLEENFAATLVPMIIMIMLGARVIMDMRLSIL